MAAPAPSAPAWDDYWDVDAILAEGEKVPVVFKTDANRVGYLEGAKQHHISAGTQLELPLWMIETLAMNDVIQLKYPKAFGTTIRRSLNASTTHVNLHRLSPYFYTFGVKFTSIVDDDALNRVLVKAFTGRTESIMCYTQGPGRSDVVEFMNTLDETEMQLYKLGLRSHHDMKKWTDRALGKLKSAEASQKR